MGFAGHVLTGFGHSGTALKERRDVRLPRAEQEGPDFSASSPGGVGSVVFIRPGQREEAGVSVALLRFPQRGVTLSIFARGLGPSAMSSLEKCPLKSLAFFLTCISFTILQNASTHTSEIRDYNFQKIKLTFWW